MYVQLHQDVADTVARTLESAWAEGALIPAGRSACGTSVVRHIDAMAT